jgi:hypothetical protein
MFVLGVVTTLVRVTTNELLPVDVPNFFLIGAAKAGTSSLFLLLTMHPEICTATKKEVRYFTSTHNFSLFGPRRTYTDSFAASKLHNCTEGNYTIDGTPDYIFDKEAAQHLAAAYSPQSLAQKKFVLVLRDPVARQFSW